MLSEEVELLLETLEQSFPQIVPKEDLEKKLITAFEPEDWLNKVSKKTALSGSKLDTREVSGLIELSKRAGLVREYSRMEGKVKKYGYTLSTAGYTLLSRTRQERLTRFSAVSVTLLTLTLISVTVIEAATNPAQRLVNFLAVIELLGVFILGLWILLRPKRRAKHLVYSQGSENYGTQEKEE